MIILKTFDPHHSGWIQVTWVDRVDTENEDDEIQVWCQSFHPTQIQMLRDKANEYNTPLDQYEEFLVEWVNNYIPPEPEPELSQFEKDRIRYQKRASVKDSLIAYMAADNMSRVRSGEWNVQDLYSLLQDANIAEANACMSTLSFELAVTCISNVTNPILTEEIKSDWIARLTEHFYLQG